MIIAILPVPMVLVRHRQGPIPVCCDAVASARYHCLLLRAHLVHGLLLLRSDLGTGLIGIRQVEEVVSLLLAPHVAWWGSRPASCRSAIEVEFELLSIF